MRSDQEDTLPLSHPVDRDGSADAAAAGAASRRRRSALAVAVCTAFAATAAVGAAARYYRSSDPSASPERDGRQRQRQLAEEEVVGDEVRGYSTPLPTDPTDPAHPHYGEAEILPAHIPGPPPMEDMTESLIAKQFGRDPYEGRDKMQMLLDGELTMIDIRSLPDSLSKDKEGDGYDNVWADFCVMDWNLHKQDPSKYPSVRDIMGESQHCSEHRYSFPLNEVVAAVREHDAAPGSDVRAVPVKGILLHEGRAGCTVVSNALAVAEPDRTRVIPEHPAPLTAVSMCDKVRNKHRSDDCDPAKQVTLLKDVVMLLSRTSDPNLTDVYLKMHASGSAYIDTIRAAFPDTNWGFCYRDADAALAKATERKRNSCLKQQRSPSQALLNYASDKSVDLASVSGVEVCSMHLATLVRSALDEFTSSGTGLLIDYDAQIKSGTDLVDTIVPYFGIDTSTPGPARDRVMDVSKMNANARHTGKHWSADEEQRTVNVDGDVRDASDKYVKKDTMNIVRARG